MNPKDCVVTNCFIYCRPSDPAIFEVSDEHGIQCHLDGYAIVPMEHYDALLKHVETIPVGGVK